MRESLDEHFDVVGGIMRVVALAAALIGAIVLVGTVAFNVVERKREVGILRALGATPARIRAIFVVEALAIALLSSMVAIAGALAMTRAMLDRAEQTLLRVEVPMRFSMEGVAILGAGFVIVLLAVRVVLAYALRAPAREALQSE
jgi:putative ABC transport system permease protein